MILLRDRWTQTAASFIIGGLLAFTLFRLLPAISSPQPWLTYDSPAVVLSRAFKAPDGLTFQLNLCNNSGKELTNIGSFIWVREDVEPREFVTEQALSNNLPPGCFTRTIVVPPPARLTPGRWHYEGHICPLINDKQCASFYTESFTITP